MPTLRYVSLPEKYSRWLSTAASGGLEILEKKVYCVNEKDISMDIIYGHDYTLCFVQKM